MPDDISALDEPALLAAASAGNVEALGLLLFRLRPTMLAAIQGRVGAKLRVTVSEEDVLQEAYRQAFIAFPQADFNSPDENSLDLFKNWLRTIALNSIHQLGRGASAKKRGGDFQRVDAAGGFREQSRDLLTELSTGDETVSQFVAKCEASDALRVALAALPAEQQQAIRLRYFDQLGVGQIAARMQRTSGSVRGLLDRARSSLRMAMHNSALWFSRHD